VLGRHTRIVGFGLVAAVVVVPTYNEAANIETLLRRIRAAAPAAHVVVVDDDSPDRTADLVAKLAVELDGIDVVRRPVKGGLGSAYRDGFATALATGADVVVQMDADLSHDPAQLPALIAAAAHADMVIGSRYIPGGHIVNWPMKRHVLSRFANAYIRAVTRVSAHDCTSGYRCWKRTALAKLPLDRFFSDGYSFLVEMLFVAHRRGCRIAEVPITFVERREGESKVSRAVLFESAITPWRLIANPETGRKASPSARQP